MSIFLQGWPEERASGYKSDSKGEGIPPIAAEYDIHFAEGRGSPATPFAVILSCCLSRCADLELSQHVLHILKSC